MTTYTIKKEKNTLTISNNEATVTIENAQHFGHYAGRTLTRIVEYGTQRKAHNAALKIAKVNGWVTE